MSDLGTPPKRVPRFFFAGECPDIDGFGIPMMIVDRLASRDSIARVYLLQHGKYPTESRFDDALHLWFLHAMKSVA